MRLSLAHHRRRAGFTLAEILLAMLVFAIAITTILALLARSIETVDEIILKDEAMRLSGAVEDYMQKLPFNTSYNVVRTNESQPSDPSYLTAYHYRATPNSLAPRADRTGTPGTEYLVLPDVRPASDPSLDGYLAAREGRLFKVLLKLSATNPATQTAVNMTTFPALPDQYPSAVVVVYAEYYPIGNKNTNPVTSNISPVYAYNFAIRR